MEEALPEGEGEEVSTSDSDGESLATDEGGSAPSDGEILCWREEGPLNEQVAAAEAFDTALASGASQEQAMAEAAEVAGLENSGQAKFN